MAVEEWSRLLDTAKRRYIARGLFGDVYELHTRGAWRFVVKQQKHAIDDTTHRKFNQELAVFALLRRRGARASWRCLFVELLYHRTGVPCSLRTRSRRNYVEDITTCAELVFPRLGMSLAEWMFNTFIKSRVSVVKAFKDRRIWGVLRQLVLAHLILFSIGVMHNDLHSGNALINPASPPRITVPHAVRSAFKVPVVETLSNDTPRIVIIDFGEATNESVVDKTLLLDEITYTILTTLQLEPGYTHSSDVDRILVEGLRSMFPDIHGALLAAHHPVSDPRIIHRYFAVEHPTEFRRVVHDLALDINASRFVFPISNIREMMACSSVQAIVDWVWSCGGGDG